MQIAFIEDTLKYDGSQLSSHFAYRRLGLLGDSCVAFLGPCEVTLSALVDLEDVRKKSPIYSPLMLHFILESFQLDLKAGVLLQRLIVSLLEAELRRQGISGLQRRGDDLYFQEKKLNVSIATRSPVSTLIHVGINVKTEGTPVPAQGLEAWGVDPLDFAKNCLELIQREYEQTLRATYKVRGVL